MPNWITAKRSSARIGKASANSVSDWPCSERSSIVRFLRLITGVRFLWSKGMGPFAIEGAPFRENAWLRQDSGDVLDGAADVVREERDRADYGESDDGEHDSVLGHRLPLLAPAQRVGGDLHEGEELQHLVTPPFSQLDAHGSRAPMA